MEYIAALLWISIETIALFFFLKAFLPQRRRGYRAYLALAFQLIFLFAVNNLVQFPVSYIRIVLNILSSVAVSFYLFGGTWYSHLLFVAVEYFALVSFDTAALYGTAAVLGISLNVLILRKLLYCTVVTVEKLIFLFLTWFLSYLRDKSIGARLSSKRAALLCLFPIMSVIMLYTVYNSYMAQGDLSISAVVVSFVLATANIAVIWLILSVERAANAEREIAVLNQSMAIQTENICSLEKSYRAQRTATHEFKHQLQAIYDLLEQEKYSTAKEYIQQLQISQTSRIFAANSNHPIVDAILNDKYHAAKESDIDISYKLNDLSKLSIGTDELVVLLSNLLGNAIEACQRLPNNRVIECTILLEDRLFLSIRNTSLPVEIKGGRIKTSKTPEREHGFGLAGVQRVVKQLHGEIAMEYSNGWFQIAMDILT